MAIETKFVGRCGRFIENSKHYIAMIALQFGFAGMNIITKVSLNQGMSHYVLVVYRHAFATTSIAPFAFVLERKGQPKITFKIFMQIFILALLGPVIDQNFYYAGLKFTSPTFACALSNILPAITFVMAVLYRMEKINMKKVRCQAKVVGTIVTVAGAILMTLYKGPILEMVWTKHAHYTHTTTNNHTTQHTSTSSSSSSSDKQWFIGSILLIIATFAWASLFVLQAKALETYKNHQLSLTSLVCFVGTLQAIVVTFVMEHNPSVWKIGFDINLLAAAYAGIVTSSLTYYVQGLVIKKKGPVFATAFSPLMMIIAAILGSFILAEKIYLGGVIGSILIVIGLYSVLWGKHKERVESKVAEVEDIALPMKASQVDANINNINNNNNYASDSKQLITNNEAKSEKAEESFNNNNSVLISMPHSTDQEPKA